MKLEGQKQERAIIGVKLGKNNKTLTNKLSSMGDVADHVDGVKKFGAIADYLVINVSSPNTVGLRGLQQKSELENLISCVLEARNNLSIPKLPPLLLKVAPDLNEDEKKGYCHRHFERESKPLCCLQTCTYQFDELIHFLMIVSCRRYHHM